MLTRWNDFGFDDLDRSFAALDDLRQEMDRVFQRFEVGWPRGTAQWPSSTGEAAWPQVQIRDEGEALVVLADVPGFTSEELDVALEQGTLTLRGERADQIPEGYSVHRKERSAVRFARSFMLPVQIEADKVEAKLKDGLLELRLPKSAAARPRTIQIKSN